VAVASDGPYANLHLAPDKQPHQHPTTQFFTGWMPFLLPNQQCQSTKGLEENVTVKNLQNHGRLLEKMGKSWHSIFIVIYCLQGLHRARTSVGVV